MRIRKATTTRALGTPRRSSQVALATYRLQPRPRPQQILGQIKPLDYLVRRLVVLRARYLAIRPLHHLALQHLYRQHPHLRFHLAALPRPQLDLLLRTLSALALALVRARARALALARAMALALALALALLVECSEVFWVNKVVDCLDKSKESRRHQLQPRLGLAVKLHQRATCLGIRKAREAAVSLGTSLQGLGRQSFKGSISRQKLQTMRLPLP
jgi:hypothetical protein